MNETILRKVAEVPGTCAGFNVRKASRAISQFYDSTLQPAGIRSTQYSLLVAIALAGEVGIGPIAEKLVTDRTTLTRNLRPLIEAGLVEQVPHADRRLRPLRLTPKGLATLENAYPLWKKAQAHIHQRLGRRRFDELKSTLGDLVSIARKEAS